MRKDSVKPTGEDNGPGHAGLRWFAAGAGALPFLLGFLVIYGWHSHDVSLIQVLPAFAPMEYNTALGFLLCGAALVLASSGLPRSAVAPAGMAAWISSLTPIEHVSGVSKDQTGGRER